MNSQQLEGLLQQLETRLKRLENLVEEIRDELRAKQDVPQKDGHLEALERTLLRLIKQWRVTIRHAISAAELYADQKGPYYIQLEFVLGHARALSRDSDIDMSWSNTESRLKRLMNDVSMSALAALFCVHEIPVPELGGMIYDDEAGDPNPARQGSLSPRLRDGILWQSCGHHDQHPQNAAQSL